MKRMRTLFDRAPLWLWIALSLAFYVLLALWFPLLPYYNKLPISDVRSFAPSLSGGLAYAALVSLLFAFFLLAYRKLRAAPYAPGLGQILGVSALFSLPLLLVYPINANDIYRYIIRGRLHSVYGQNPFTVAPAAMANDPFLPLAGEWSGATSPYGPLWELTASGITAVTGDGLLLGMLAFKLLSLLAFLGASALLWLIFRRAAVGAGNGLPSAAAQTILWAWNPALLLTFVANAHNDALMIFFLLFGYYVMRREREVLGFLLMLLGPLIKPIALLALPFFFLDIWRARLAYAARLRFLMATLLGGLLLAFLAFLPFGMPWQLARRLLVEATAGASFSPAATLILIGQGLGVDTAASFTLLARLGALFLLIAAVVLLWATYRGRSPLRGTADIYFAYLLQAFNFRIWYTAWPFPWLLLDAVRNQGAPPTSFRLHYGLYLLLTAQLSVVLYGHIRVTLLQGSQLQAHLLGMLFVFIVPLLAALAGTRRVI